MKKSFRGWLVVAFLVAATALGAAASALLDRLFAPWAFERAGRPALTGSWVGSLTTATGRPRGVLLELLLPEPKSRGGLVRDWRDAPYGELGGTARLCDERGQVRAYTIDGEPEDRQATRLVFHLAPAETPAPEGLTPSWVRGGWDRINTLDLQVGFHWRKDDAAISGPDYPDTRAEAALALTRGGDVEFRALCARLSRRGREGV